MLHAASARYLITVLIGGKGLYGESLSLDHAEATQYTQTEATGGKGKEKGFGYGVNAGIQCLLNTLEERVFSEGSRSRQLMSVRWVHQRQDL